MGVENHDVLTLIGWALATIIVQIVGVRVTRTIDVRLRAEAPERVLGAFTDDLLLRLLRTALKLLRWVAWVVLLLLVMASFPFSAPFVGSIWRVMVQAFGAMVNLFTRPLFPLGDQVITLRFLIILTVILAGVSLGSTAVRRGMRRHVLSHLGLEVGVQETLATVAGYLFLVVGGLIALDLVGLDLSTLALIAGALSIGIGFGLQNIANNFISGLILLVERPIKVGDRIEVGDIHGEVVRISARSTCVRTNDNIDIIVPNAELISGRVTNWSQKDRRIRFRVPVGVAYGTDVDLAMGLMEEAGREVAEVLRSPAPAARFIAFGDSALELELRVWTVKRLHRKGRLISDVNRAIYHKFAAHDIAIPFPQRDLHVKSWPSASSVPGADPDSTDQPGDHIVDDGR